MDLTNQNKDKKTRRKTTSVETAIFGKVPPQARDLEEAILGAIMLEKEAYYTVKDILFPECFYVEANQRIFKAMMKLEEKHHPIDLLTVVEQLRNSEELDLVGGPYYVTKITNGVVSAANIERHSRIVFQKFLRRVVIQSSGELLNDAYEDNVDDFDLVDKMMKANDLLLTKYLPKEIQYDKLVFRTVQNIFTDKEELNGIISGFNSLDKIIDFFINGLFYIIAARPSMGKTAFMVQLVENFTKEYFVKKGDDVIKLKPKPVGIIELETHDEAFVQRQLANISGIDSRKFKRGDLLEEEKEKVHSAANDLINKGIICDFTPVSTITDIRIKGKAWKKKYNIGVLLIDYIQYIEAEDFKMPRERQVAAISKGCASLAKELNIPVIAFAQLSRELYKRADKRPQISDLRESGSLEQDARCIMFLHRPEYYGETQDPDTGMLLKGITEVIVAKNNEGDVGTIKLRMRKELSRFEELGDEDLIPYVYEEGQKGTNNLNDKYIPPPEWDEENPF